MRVIFIDGNNSLYRFGYALKTLTTEDGTHTGAIYGFFQCLMRLRTRYRDAKFVVVWDGNKYKQNGWRSKVYPQYKMNRLVNAGPAVPIEQNMELQAILIQYGAINRCLNLIGIPQACVEEIECDDLIGVLSAQCVREGWEPIIYSNDKDFFQLMAKGVKLIRDVVKPSTMKFEDVQSVQTHFRCALQDVLKVRAICGDSSDGIPGIQKGVGAVKAAAFVNQCSNWDVQLKGNPALAINYRIMKIVCDELDEEILSHRVPVVQEMGRVMGILRGKIKMRHDPVDKRVLIETLAQLELQDLIAHRDELWALG